MDWAYDPRARCWRLTLGAWEARVGRWPASLEYTAQLIAASPGRRVINAPHVFAQMAAAQAWCLREFAGQEAPEGSRRLSPTRPPRPTAASGALPAAHKVQPAA